MLTMTVLLLEMYKNYIYIYFTVYEIRRLVILFQFSQYISFFTNYRTTLVQKWKTVFTKY